MHSYSYNYFLPDGLLREITDAIVEFATTHELVFDLWYHDLPVWVVRRQTGDRVDQVQIESVITAAGPVLTITPDAYEDKSSDCDGVTSMTRLLANADDVINLRSQIHTNQLIAPGNTRFRKPKPIILHYLSEAWGNARQLRLREAQSWRHASGPRD